MELTNGAGVNLVLDSVGGATLESSIASLAYRGRISWVGRAGREERPPEVWPIMQKNATITGVFLGAEMGMNPGRTHALIGNLLGRIAKKELDVVIDKTFPLSEAAAAHRYIEDRKAFGRVLLTP
jgi:NADPH2:quinone reductase